MKNLHAPFSEGIPTSTIDALQVAATSYGLEGNEGLLGMGVQSHLLELQELTQKRCTNMQILSPEEMVLED